MAILNDDEFVEIEGRAYANPQVILDESNAFIENLRNTQQANNQKIQTDTYNLGTAVPSNLGGLTSPSGDTGLSYFTSRYQVPQTEAAVANLRATAQAAALNQALQNEQEMWKKRYNDAYRNYQKRQYNRAYGGGGGTTGGGGGGGGLGIDTNIGAGETVEVSTYSPQAGQIIPNTDYVSDYQDAATGKWYQLTSPREIDVIAAGNTLTGRNPSDGATVNVNGKTLRYVAATDSWYEQTNSAGPNTYSPRAR